MNPWTETNGCDRASSSLLLAGQRWWASGSVTSPAASLPSLAVPNSGTSPHSPPPRRLLDLVLLPLATWPSVTARKSREQERESGLRDRYTTAAQQLADDSPAIREAGIYALAALGDDWIQYGELTHQRQLGRSELQVCVNLLCSYLRANRRIGTDEQEETREEELNVRRSVVGVLRLRSSSWRKKRSGWGYVSLPLNRADLTNANLTDADLTGADLSGANLTGANLMDANLTRASLMDANLTRATCAETNGRAKRTYRTIPSTAIPAAGSRPAHVGLAEPLRSRPLRVRGVSN